MFGLFKKKPKKGKNDAAIETLKRRMEQKLICPELLKKMGIKSLFHKDNAVKKQISYEDACICLLCLQDVIAKLTAFSDAFLPMADEANERLQQEKADAIRNHKPMKFTDDFYTLDNIMRIFNEVTADVTGEASRPEDMANAMRMFRVYLPIIFMKSDILMRMIHIKAGSAAITI